MTSNYTNRISEVIYPLAYFHSTDKTADTYNTTGVSLKNYHRAWVVLDVGDMDQGATLNLKLQEATSTDAADGDWSDIDGKSITELTAADTDDDSLVCIELQTEELTVASNYDCIRAQLVIANAAVQVSLIIYGVESRFEPVPTTNWEEIVD